MRSILITRNSKNKNYKGNCWRRSTASLLRVFWQTASLFGMLAARKRTREPSKDDRYCSEIMGSSLRSLEEIYNPHRIPGATCLNHYPRGDVRSMIKSLRDSCVKWTLQQAFNIQRILNLLVFVIRYSAYFSACLCMVILVHLEATVKFGCAL